MITALLITALSSLRFKMYSRKPVKNAPAPSAITVRSRKIQRPKAKRLSMLVWLSPFTRQRPAPYRPKASSAHQGRIQSRNCRGLDRRTPRGMRWVSTSGIGGLLSLLCGSLPDPRPRGAVVDLGLGAQPLQDAERMPVARQAGHLARGVV